MATIGELARIGKENYTRKIPGMHKSYAAASGRAQAGYDATPFGPTRKGNYKAAWTVMPAHYTAKVTTAGADKWERVWSAKMAE